MFLHTKDLECWGAWDTTCRNKTTDVKSSLTWRGGGGEERHEQLICFDSLKGQCLLLHPCHFITVTYSMIILTPSLPQPVKFPGWKMHGCACKQCIFWSYNTSTFNAMRFDENLFTCQCGREKKGLRVSNFALFMVIFKWHQGSEGVKGVPQWCTWWSY